MGGVVGAAERAEGGDGVRSRVPVAGQYTLGVATPMSSSVERDGYEGWPGVVLDAGSGVDTADTAGAGCTKSAAAM